MVTEAPGQGSVASWLEYEGIIPDQCGLNRKAGSTGLQLNRELNHNIPLLNIWE